MLILGYETLKRENENNVNENKIPRNCSSRRWRSPARRSRRQVRPRLAPGGVAGSEAPWSASTSTMRIGVTLGLPHSCRSQEEIRASWECILFRRSRYEAARIETNFQIVGSPRRSNIEHLHDLFSKVVDERQRISWNQYTTINETAGTPWYFTVK